MKSAFITNGTEYEDNDTFSGSYLIWRWWKEGNQTDYCRKKGQKISTGRGENKSKKSPDEQQQSPKSRSESRVEGIGSGKG